MLAGGQLQGLPAVLRRAVGQAHGLADGLQEEEVGEGVVHQQGPVLFQFRAGEFHVVEVGEVDLFLRL